MDGLHFLLLATEPNFFYTKLFQASSFNFVLCQLHTATGHHVKILYNFTIHSSRHVCVQPSLINTAFGCEVGFLFLENVCIEF